MRLYARLVTVLLVIVSPAAEAVLPTLAIDGFLVDSTTGLAVDDVLDVTVAFYAAESDPPVEALHAEVIPDVMISDGWFYIMAGSTKAIDPSLWVELSELWIGIELPGEGEMRFPVASIASAFLAGRAAVATSLDSAAVATLFDAASPLGIAGLEVCAVDGDILKASEGSWTCGPDLGTTYTAAGGLTLSTDNEFSIDIPDCVTDQVVKFDGSGYVCAADRNTTYTAGGGLALVDGALSLATTNCVAGQTLKLGDSGFTCANDTDTTYSVTNGLTLSGPNDTIIGLIDTCSTGEVLKSAGGTFSCAADNDTNTTYTAANGIALGGTNDTVIGLITSCGDGQVLKSSGGAFACANDIDTNTDTDTTYTVTNGLALSGGSNTVIGLTTSCDDGDVLKSSGGDFTCEPDLTTADSQNLVLGTEDAAIGSLLLHSDGTAGGVGPGIELLGDDGDDMARINVGGTDGNSWAGFVQIYGAFNSTPIILDGSSSAISTNLLTADTRVTTTSMNLGEASTTDGYLTAYREGSAQPAALLTVDGDDETKLVLGEEDEWDGLLEIHSKISTIASIVIDGDQGGAGPAITVGSGNQRGVVLVTGGTGDYTITSGDLVRVVSILPQACVTVQGLPTLHASFRLDLDDGDDLVCPIDLNDGTVVTDITCTISQDDTGDATIRRYSAEWANETVASWAVDETSATDTSVITLGTDFTIDNATYRYYLRVEGDTDGARFEGCQISARPVAPAP